MKIITLLIALVFLMGCAHSDPWTKGDTVLEGIHLATVIADGIGTSKIQYHPNLIENGPIAKHALGRNPKTSDVWMYMATVAVSHWFVSRMLPKGWRSIWQGVGIARHGSAVNSGHQMGLFSQPCTTPVAEEFACAP